MRTRDENKYNAIVQESIKLTQTYGFSGISISKIAKGAVVSPGTIYIYFKNKEDLLVKIYCDIQKYIGEQILSKITMNMSIEEQFRCLWKSSISFYLDHLEIINYREQFEQTPMMELVDPSKFQMREYTIELIKKGKERKIFKELPLSVLISFSFVPMITLVKLHITNVQQLNEALIEKAIDIAWQSLVKKI
jgi:AcrR family transcriptional regulator